jgi:hypothetical protein
VFSGVVSGVVTHHLATSRQEREFKRRRIEELFLAAQRFEKAITTANVAWPRAMRGEISFNQALDFQTEVLQKLPPDQYETIEMLVNIYFEPLRAYFEVMIKRRDAMNAVQEQFRGVYRGRGPSPECREFVSPFLKALREFHDSHERFNDALFVEAQHIGGRGPLARCLRRFREIAREQFQ